MSFGQDAPSNVRDANTSVACSMEDCSLLSSSMDGLECSEDICYEDSENLEDACCEMHCNEQHRSYAPVRGPGSAALDADVLGLIRYIIR
jgi:hypothetical protein